jgi:hypothetical protein
MSRVSEYLKWRVAGPTEVVEIRGQHFPQLREWRTPGNLPGMPDHHWQEYVCPQCPWTSGRTMDIARDRREMHEEGQKATPVRVSPKTLHASDRLTALHGQPLSALLLCGWPLHKPVYEKLPVDRRDSRGRDHGSIAWMTGPVSSPPAAAPIHPAAACSPATAPP